MPSPDRRSRLFAALAAAAALCSAVPALAAQIKDVRVGAHPKFTRIVFELDGKAGYRVERAGSDAAPELRITIEATSGARSLRASGDVRGVKVDAGSQARAHIALRTSGLRVREMILSDPPRIVIDVVKAETAVAAATASKPASKPAAETQPSPKPVAEAKPSPSPAPKPVAEVKPSPAPSPKPLAEVKPSPSPAPKAIAEVKPSPSPSPQPLAEAKPAPAPPAVIPAPRTDLAVPPEPPKPTPTESASAPAISPAPTASPAPPDVAKLPPPALPSPAPLPPAPPVAVVPSPPAPAPVAPVPAPPTPAAPPSSWSDRLGDPLTLGLIGAAVLGLAAIAVVLRRRRALPNDLDVTAIAEEVEQSSDAGASGRIPSGGFAMGDDSSSAPVSSFGGLFDQPISAAPPAPPAPMPVPERSAPPIAMPTPSASDAEDSLFDDAGAMPGEPESGGDAAMDTEMDFPVDRRTSPTAARMGGSAAPSGPAPDVARMLQEFERRIATLEARLDESNEAREKLERQVAAQSEELRVQRAAIARTQRALRTMTRGDEDKATEPALRDGETQAKTRVTP
jgi:hypothetical protein